MKQGTEWFLRPAILLLVVLFGLIACSEAPEPDKEESPRPVKIAIVGENSAKATREYPGVISAEQSVQLGFEVPGRIIELPVIEGQQVSQGDVLAKLDPRDYRAARDAAKSNYVTMDSVYRRAKRIFDQQAGSQAEVDLALRDLDIAREELRKAEKALDDAVLLSPFTGEIGRKLADNFQNIQAKQPVVLLHNVQDLEVDFSIPEQDFVLAEGGLDLESLTTSLNPVVVLSSLPDRTFVARFRSFSSAANPVTRSYTVTLAFANPEAISVRPGMTAKVVLRKQSDAEELGEGRFMLPVTAVAVLPDQTAYVWKVTPDTMQVSRLSVNAGPMSGGMIQVSGNLHPGDQVAASGVHFLREGMKVYPLSSQ